MNLSIPPSMPLLATGIFMWLASERRTDRYGAFYLTYSSYDGDDTKLPVTFDESNIAALSGKRVRIVVKVVENRPSGHCGDEQHKIKPKPLKAPKSIELAVGILQTESNDYGNPQIAVRPEDGRETFWIDPRLLYQLHDQTVEVYAEESAAPAHPVFKGNPAADGDAIVNSDGSFQVKTRGPVAGYRLEPRVESMGGGMFMVTTSSLTPGSRHRLKRA